MGIRSGLGIGRFFKRKLRKVTKFVDRNLPDSLSGTGAAELIVGVGLGAATGGLIGGYAAGSLASGAGSGLAGVTAAATGASWGAAAGATIGGLAGVSAHLKNLPPIDAPLADAIDNRFNLDLPADRRDRLVGRSRRRLASLLGDDRTRASTGAII